MKLIKLKEQILYNTLSKNIDIKNTHVAQRYANALKECSMDCIDEIREDLKVVLDGIFNNDELKAFFNHPIISLADKKDTIRQTLEGKINNITLNFLETLLNENRFGIFNTIYVLYIKETDKVKNRQQVEVICAQEPTDEQKNKLWDKLNRKLSKETQITYIKDEDIIGGLIIRIEDNVIDLSLKNKFEALRKNN